MKKFLMCAAALLMAVTAVSAQTPEEKEASAKRVEQLKSEAPKACGVAEIDDAAKTAETNPPSYRSMFPIISNIRTNVQTKSKYLF